MAEERCLHCKTKLEQEHETCFLPFCSERCRMLDLGAWLDEDYVIASSDVQEEEAP